MAISATESWLNVADWENTEPTKYDIRDAGFQQLHSIARPSIFFGFVFSND
jgi:hypothetical protein